jgi:hypothetical protein
MLDSAAVHPLLLCICCRTRLTEKDAFKALESIKGQV